MKLALLPGAAALLLLAAGAGVALDFINDCTGNPQPAFEDSNPEGLDYYDVWEKPIEGIVQVGSEAPPSAVGAVITTTCTISGHSVVGSPGFACPDGLTCTKFWAWERVLTDPHGFDAAPACGMAQADGAVLDGRTTWNPDQRTLFCEWYCPSNVFQCQIGRTVQVRVGLGITYTWEAGEPPTLPGDTGTASVFEFESRPTRDVGPTEHDVTHVTCEAGLPELHDFAGVCR
jgi:hypothetical protein